MFHCNGWAYTWAVTAMGAKHVCLREVGPGRSGGAAREEGVTHLCAAPTVLLDRCSTRTRPRPLDEPCEGVRRRRAAVARRCWSAPRRSGSQVTHLYGLTETYGPIAVCAWQPGLGRAAAPRSRRAARPPGRGDGRLRARCASSTSDVRDVPARRRDARRGGHARQQRDDRLLPRRRGDRGGVHAAAGSTPATSASCTRTATSSCATASRT